jgi:hypothetical protein
MAFKSISALTSDVPIPRSLLCVTGFVLRIAGFALKVVPYCY